MLIFNILFGDTLVHSGVHPDGSPIPLVDLLRAGITSDFGGEDSSPDLWCDAWRETPPTDRHFFQGAEFDKILTCFFVGDHLFSSELMRPIRGSLPGSIGLSTDSSLIECED